MGHTERQVGRGARLKSVEDDDDEYDEHVRCDLSPMHTKTSSVPATPDMKTPVCSASADRTDVWKAGTAVLSRLSGPIFAAPFQAKTQLVEYL